MRGDIGVHSRVAFDVVEWFEHAGVVLGFEQLVQAVFGAGEAGGVGSGEVEFIAGGFGGWVSGGRAGDFLAVVVVPATSLGLLGGEGWLGGEGKGLLELGLGLEV